MKIRNQDRGTAWHLLLMGAGLFLGAAPTNAQDLIANGGFENEDLKPWTWSVNGGCEAEGQISSGEKHSGAQSFFITRKSPFVPNVYGSLAQWVNVKPGTKYRLSIWAKGTNVTKAIMICGKGWKAREAIPIGTFDWQKIEMDYTTLPEETSMPVLIIADGPAEALWVDDARLENTGEGVANTPDRKIHEPAVWTGIPASAAFYPVLPSGGRLPLLGLFSEKKPRFGANVRMERTATDLQLNFDVEDPTFGCVVEGDQMWRGDSIQLAIDIGSGSNKTEVANTYFELGFSLLPSGEVSTYAWAGNFNWPAVRTSGEKTEKGYRLSVSIPWENIYLDPDKLPHSIRMNIVVNDAARDGARRFVEWTPGMATMKNPDLFARIFIVDPEKGKTVAYLQPDEPVYDQKDPIRGRYIEYALEDLPESKLLFAASADKSSRAAMEPIRLAPLKAGETRRVDFDFPAAQLTREGEYQIVAESVVGEKTQLLAAAAILRQDLATKIARELANAEARVDALNKSMDAKPELAGDSKLEAGFAIVRHFIDRVRANRSSRIQGVEWSILQLGEIQTVMDQMEKRIASRQEAEKVPTPTGPVTLKDGFFYAKTEGDAKAPERVFYYYGYGHFASVRRDAALLSKLGSTIIQQECGPRAMNPDLTGLDDQFYQGVRNSLEAGEKNGLKVDFLLSPHYFPKWAAEKAPDVMLKQADGLKQNIDHPLAKKIQEAYLKTIVPMVKDSPALFSFGLSNEPVWSSSGYSEYSRPDWINFLKGKYPDIGELNQLYETECKSFEEVPLPANKAVMPLQVPAQRAYYDWVIFNMEHFAGWHKWMNGIIKSIAPNIPTHAKIMAEVFDRTRVFRGVDPELFCDVTDLAGNDCWSWPRPVEFYAYSWQTEEMWYDLLHSFKGQSIFNSENHFITDRSPAKSIDPEHTRCIFWQGALHHQGVTTAWVWEEAVDPVLEGSIYFRPANIYAASEAMFDLNRLAGEVKAVSSHQGEVAILYSMTSLFWEEDYTKALATAYAALNFSGQQVTFISEKQLASGQRSSANAKIRYIIIPRATHVKEGTVKGLAEFVAKGGRILALGNDNLKYDEYHRELKLPASLENIPSIEWAIARDELVAVDLRESLEKMGLKITRLLSPVKNEATWGLEYRVVPQGKGAGTGFWKSLLQKLGYPLVPQGKGTLVPITNMMNKTMEFRVPLEGKAIDLLSGKSVNLQKMELAPMESLLLQIE